MDYQDPYGIAELYDDIGADRIVVRKELKEEIRHLIYSLAYSPEKEWSCSHVVTILDVMIDLQREYCRLAGRGKKQKILEQHQDLFCCIVQIKCQVKALLPPEEFPPPRDPKDLLD